MLLTGHALIKTGFNSPQLAAQGSPSVSCLLYSVFKISLPGQMKAWVEECVHSGRYANSSGYVRDLIRRDKHGKNPDCNGLFAEAPARDRKVGLPAGHN
jgi:hypothetical protein